LVAVGLFVSPFSYGVVHVALDFDTFVAEGWVVEGAEDVAHYFVDGDTWVLPSVEDSSVGFGELGDDHMGNELTVSRIGG
jgi:hypothetical protein